MTDDLRTRIATTLWKFAQPDSRLPDPPEVFFGMADAIIAEMGLQPNLAKRIINGKPDQWVRRHVTDWEIVYE
jgi:hypothetical protein